MKLPEAIALMLEGKVMTSGSFGILWRAFKAGALGTVHFQSFADDDGLGWTADGDFEIDGWREATPEELKEIGL